MDYENLRKFLSEISDIVYQERIRIIFFFGIALIAKLGFYVLELQNLQKQSVIEVVKVEKKEGRQDVENLEYTVSHPKTRLFSFRPETVTYDELLKLGLNPKTAHTFLNYRNKGGKFYKKSDLKKIYGLDKDLYRRIEPYIIIEERMVENDKPNFK